MHHLAAGLEPARRRPPGKDLSLKAHMKLLTDCFGHAIRLTDERLAHILEHPEMRELEPQIERVLLHPEIVRRSRTDPAAHLFYRYYAQTLVGSKWLCIVVKYTTTDAFIVTAYLTDQPKRGEDLWPIK